jgi:hypothetical protein
MALPPELRTPRLERIQTEINNMRGGAIFGLPHLIPPDYQLFGAFIQLYNYMDMNLRRCVEAFHIAQMLPSNVESRWRNLREAKLVGIINGVVATMDADVEPIAETIGRLTEIEYRRGFRNMMGHFAARRFPNEETIIFFSNDDRDAMRVHSSHLAPTEVLNSVVDVSTLQEMLEHMAWYEEWIATKAAEWYGRYVPDLNVNSRAPHGDAG